MRAATYPPPKDREGFALAAMVVVTPHDYLPLRIWDRWMQDGRCGHCYFPRHAHASLSDPTAIGANKTWTIARLYTDKTRLTFAEAMDMDNRRREWLEHNKS